MLKKIKEKLHKMLFPSFHRDISYWKECWEESKDLRFETVKEKEQEVEQLKSKIADYAIKLNKIKERPVPSMADLMRENLKLVTVDFTHQEAGVPKHFLDLPDDEHSRAKRKMYIAQLAQIQQLEVWPAMIQNLIDTQGNYSFRLALTPEEQFAGRMTVNGISLLQGEVKSGYDEYMEMVGPKEDFDPTDNSSEGVPYSADQEKD